MYNNNNNNNNSNSNNNDDDDHNKKHILLDVLLSSTAEHFYAGRVKIQTTSKNSQWYYATKRLIRDLFSNTLNCCVRASANFVDVYLRGMRDRSGAELARELQLTKLFFLTVFLRLIYLVNLDQYSPAIPSLCRNKINFRWLVTVSSTFQEFDGPS